MEEPRPGTGGSDLRLLSREELEAAVRERTDYLEDVMNTMVDVLVRTDANGRIEMANDAIEERLGYQPDALIGKPIDVLFAPPAENESLSALFERGEFLEYLMADGQLTDLEIYFETRDGEAVPMSVSASVTTDGDGSLSGIVCVAKDISERKEAEETAEFLHSLLRHDLGNRLQITRGYLEMLEDADLGEPETTYVEKAQNGVEDAKDLIRNVRMLQRAGGDVDREPIALAGAVEEALSRLEGLREQVEMTVDVDVGDHRVMAGALLPAVFENLVGNALRHSEGSRVEVRAAATDEGVRVTVVDDGRGIPPDERERIFEQGETGTDSSGSGLGMHLVARLVQTYGGDVAVSAADLGGARFDVTLEAAED